MESINVLFLNFQSVPNVFGVLDEIIKVHLFLNDGEEVFCFYSKPSYDSFMELHGFSEVDDITFEVQEIPHDGSFVPRKNSFL